MLLSVGVKISWDSTLCLAQCMELSKNLIHVVCVLSFILSKNMFENVQSTLVICKKKTS